MTKKLLLLAILLLTLSGVGATLEIRFTSDLHGELEKMAALGSALQGDVLRIDVGDTVQGTLFSQLTGGRLMIGVLNLYEYDCWIPGNHDFEFGLETVTRLAGEFRGMVLGADWRIGEYRPATWKLFERNGVRCAVIGLTDPKMGKRVLPGSGVEFEHPRVVLRRLMPEIRAARPEVVVLAWHNGLFSLVGPMSQFLREFPEIDLVLGAHSHEERPGERVARAWFVQSGAHAAAVGRVTIEIDDRSREILRIESGLLRPDRENPDAACGKLVAGALPAYRQAAEVRFRVEAADWEAFARQCGAALRRATDADGAFFSFKPPEGKPPAELTGAALFRLLPYENRLCTLRFEPEELRRFIEVQKKRDRLYGTRSWFIGIAPEAVTGPVTLVLTEFAALGLPELGERVNPLPATERGTIEAALPVIH